MPGPPNTKHCSLPTLNVLIIGMQVALPGQKSSNIKLVYSKVLI